MGIKENKSFLLWTPSYYPRFGGLESVTREYASFVKSRGWEVKIISNKYPLYLPKLEQIDNIDINRYLFLNRPINYLKNKRLDLFFAYFIIKPFTLFRLMFYFKKNKPNVVNVHFLDNQLIELVLLHLFLKFDLFVSLHGDEVERLSKIKKNSFRYILYLRIFNQSKYITFCSSYLLEKFTKTFNNFNKKKLLVVQNGINKKFIFSNLIEQKKEYVFSAARFVPKKGLSMLFDIFNSKTVNRLQVAGGRKNDVPNLASNISQNIIFLGVLNRKQIINKLKFAKLTIVPSIKEPYGIIVPEAICCGSPLVATNVGGIPEIINSIRNKLNKHEKKIFDYWVKLVEPDTQSIEIGVNSIIANTQPIKRYLELVENIRSEFLWDKKLQNFFYRLENFD